MAAQRQRPGRTLIIFFAVIAVLYAAIAALHTWSPKLGLDLRGGTEVTLTAANSTGKGSVDKTSLELARQIIQKRVDGLGVGETEVTTEGDNHIVVRVPNVAREDLLNLVGRTAQLSFRQVMYSESVAAAQPTASASPAPSGSASAAPSGSPSGTAGATASAAPSGAATATAAPSASASATGNNRPAPALPTAPPPPKTPRPSVDTGNILPVDKALAYQPSQQDAEDFGNYKCGDKFPDVADQPLIACDQAGATKYFLSPVLVQGRQLTDAKAVQQQNQLNWQVDLTFNATGAKQFEDATGALAKKQAPANELGIVLDGQVVSSPSVEKAIPGGNAQITGSFNEKSAGDLANVLRYGALPLNFDVSSVDNVSATLGSDQLRAGIIAGLIGLGLVVLYSFLYYRGLGIVVVASLVVAALITWVVLVLLGQGFDYALSLAGIAGAIVAIGVTADSFIIYFERIRDEVRDGRSLRTAVQTGWQKARSTIVVADCVSLLSALVLAILAVGGVRGFAITLGVTTLIDLAIVFFFTHPLMLLLSHTKFYGEGHKMSGLDPEHMGVDRVVPVRAATRRRSSRVDPAAETGRVTGSTRAARPDDTDAAADVAPEED